MADSKNMVIKIVSDAKDFVKGMEDALRQIQSASQKAQSFDKIAEDAANLKEELSKVTENLRDMESATRADTTAVDAQIGALKNNVDILNRKFDSFRHTFGTLQETVRTLNTDNLNSQIEKMASNMKEVTSQYMLLRKESESFLSNKTNINDITNINQLEKAFDEAKFLFENFNNSNKKNLKGGYSKEYQEAASALFKYAEALIQVDDVYANSNNGDSILSEDRLNSLAKISEEASKVIGSQAPQIRKAIETMFSSIDVESFFQKQITGTIDSGTKGFLVKGAIEIPVKLKENAKLNISAEVNKIIDDAQKQINDNPIKFNFEPIEEKDNKLLQTINSYFDDISKRLQEQAQELNNVMSKILNETGIKDTQQNFEGVSTSIVQLLASLKDFAKEITSIETANEKFNTSFSSENLSLYVKNLEEISNSFKNLTSAIDNISSKLNKNGLESQFEIVKNKYSNLDLDLLMGEKKRKKVKAAQDLGLSINEIKEEEKDLNLIKEKKKQLRELFSLYSTYQARGGIRPISDLLFGETNEEKIKYINNEYKKYIKNNKTSKKKTDKTDLGSDLFIPSGILETDKEQLNEILSLLKDINIVLQDIGKTGISTSNNLKSLKTNNVNGKSDSPKIQETRSSKQKPVIPSKKENEQGQQSIQKEQQIQEERTTQEIINTNQTVVESNKELAKSTQEAAQVIQQEKTTVKELTKEEKEKKISGLMYHLGNLNNPSKRLSHPFGDEIKSWFTGIKDSGRGWGDGTGLYTTKDINAFSQKSLSEKSLERFYAIDTSDLNLYEAHAEETAKEFNDFIHHLEQFCISMGSNFEGFDNNLEGIDEESLFSTAQKLFPNFNNIFKDFNSFYDWVNQMITLVSKSGIKADGTINPKQMYNFKKEYGADDIKTRFLKQLGYQGTDLSGTSFGGTQSGNVIFDILDAERIVASGKQIDEVSQRAKNTIIDIKEEIKETSKAENELGKEVENVAKNLEIQNKEIKESPSDTIITTQPATTMIKKPVAIEKQIPIEENNIQEQVEQTENNIENSEQNILNLVNNIKESLDGLRRDLKILAEMIVVVQGAAEQKDYVGQIETIKNGIITLNILILELSNNIKSIDFGKIGKLELPSDPFENVVNSLKEIIDLIERISGQASKTNLNSQFEYIQSLYNSMVNKKGNFVARGNKDKMQQMYSLYDEYKNAGGEKTLHELTNSKSNQDKIDRHYGYYQSKLNSNNSNQNSTKNKESVEKLKTENEALKESVKILTEVISNKQKLSDTNKSVAESTKSSVKEIENENQKIKESNNQVENKTNKRSKKKKEQYSPNFTMVGEPYGEEIVNKNLQKNTSIVPTNGFTMVGDGYVEDVEHTQVRVQKAVKETTKQIEQQKTELETAPNIEVFEGEVIGAEKELAKIYQQELDEFKKGFKSYEEAYRSMEERFAEWYETQGYNHTKSIFNITPDFQLKSATITRENPEDKNIITDSFKRITNKKTGESKIIQTNIQLIDNEQKRISSFTKELERNQREREKLGQWIASFNNKTSDNFKQTNQMLELNQLANDASLINEKSLQRAETLKTQLETVYNDVVNNARRGSSSLSPIPNMMFGEESTLTKLEKAKSIYSKMAVTWNKEDDSKRLKNTEKELQLLADTYKELEEAVKRYDTIDENGNRLGNVVEVSNAYGNFNEQLNKVTQQLNRIKIINTEINGNKINNLNNWFKDIPNPNEIEAQNLGKIDKYTEVYNQFVDFQNRLQSLTTNLSRDDDDYKNKKQQIHEITLELDRMKKILLSDDMNLSNQMGAVIKQNLPEVNDVRELDNVVDEYIKDLGVLQKSTDVGIKADKEGNEIATLTREIKDSKGVVTEFEFTYNKAMGTIAVATKKIQQPESIFKQITDELTTKWRGLFTTLASFVGFYRLWGYFKQGIATVREFDSALTEMQKVSDETISTLQQYQKTTFDTADAIGATALQIQNSTADFMRLGESLEEAAESAKVANILMNVSEFESINEATKSLIAMSAAYDNLSKMDIIDKLNEVGNNYAISTSEAATALQNSASALKTAGNDMDESLALITAGNAVVQDANKVGTGMRTIALRLTGTKSAKEQLEEMGEETENVITTQSKLRDTIKEATAVASNEFKGFDILDDNGNYKSTYEIMLGIAEIYNEILETDKQLGRNNANLLLESVAGKVRANIAASIFQNPELLKEAYKSSQEAENSAMEENEKYMNSINGHIAQLQNAYQQLWANSMNRDTINYFIDLGKSILKVVDNVGLLGTAFVTITSIKSIVGYQNGKGFAYELIKGSKKVIENLAKQEGALGSLASTAVSAGQTVGGAFSSAIPIIGGVATAVGLAAVGINAFIQYQKRMRKELVDSANSTGNNWQEQKQSLSDYISQYEALKKKLDSENLSEQETIEIKQQIFDIQKQITEQYGNNAEGIDLINGKLQDQLNIINNISQAEANRIWQSEKYQEGFNFSQEEILNPKALKIYGEGTTKEVQNILNSIFGQKNNESFGTGSFASYYQTSGDIYKNRKQLEDAIAQIEKLKNEIPQEETKTFDGILVQLRKNLDKVNEVINENEANYLNGLQIKLSANNSKGYSIFENYQSSVSSLEDAYITGNTQKIQEARKAYIEATIEKNKFLNNNDYNKNKEFDALFESIDTSIVEKKNQYADVAELLSGIVAPEENRFLLKQEEDKNDLYKDNSKALRKYTDSEKKVRKEAERLYKLNPDRIDIEGTLLDNTYASGKYANALNSLQNALGWSADDAQGLVDILIDVGIVQGSAADMADYSANSYGNFSSSVEEAINALSVLNTVMSESYSGQGITDQTLEQFKQTFGDGAYQALEKTANGYHINAQEAYSLRKQQEALVDTDYSSALSQQYNALNKLNEGYRKAIYNNEDTSAFAEQRKAIENNITKLQDRMMAFNNANSAYQTWIANQSNNGERQMYESIYGGFDTIKDEFEHGWAGVKTRSWMDLILGDESETDFDVWDAQATELKKRYDQLSKDIEGTGGYSIKDFFTADDNGKITSTGVMNFFKAIENKQDEVGEKFVDLEEGWFDFTNGGDQRIANLFGIDIEAVDAILRAAAEAGAEVKLDQPIFSAERLEEEAIKAKTSLEKDLGGELNINLNPDSIEEANLDMAKLTEYRDKLASDTSLEPTVKTKRLEELSDIMAYISTKEREIVENNIIDFEVKNTDLIKADKEINSIFSGLEHYSDRFGKRTDGINKILSVDPSTLNDLTSLKYFYGTVREAKLTPEVNDEQVAMLDALLKAIEDKINAINNKPVEGQSLSFSQYEQGLKTITQINNTIKKAKESGADFEFNWEGDEEFMSLVEFIDGLDAKQKMQLGLDPDINAQQILEIARNGGTIELGVESNTTPAQLTTPQPQTKQELQQVITTELKAHDTATPTIENASKSAGYFGKTYTAELDAKDNASKKIEKPQEKADEFGKTKKEAEIRIKGADTSNAKIDDVKTNLLSMPNKVSSSIHIDISGANKITNALDDLSKLRNAARNNIHLNLTQANGTAHVQGTAFSRGSIVSGNAFAGGKWGISKNQTALTGELGTEIVVRDGNWFTVGEDGAEFVNLQKGDIVFNHKQAQELLENGYVTSNKGRGKLVGFANGSAFASGSAYDGGSKGSTTGMLGSTTDKKTTGKTTSSNKDTSKGKTTPKTTSKEANKTKNTLDEVEILIARIERQIANLDKTISSTYKTWSTRNNAIKSDLAKVAQEIKDQNKAYTTYIKKANSVGLNAAWKKKVQSGKFKIEDVTDEKLWQKIQDYKQW